MELVRVDGPSKVLQAGGPYVSVDMVGANTTSTFIRLHFLLTCKKYSVAILRYENLTPRKYFARNIFHTKISRSTVLYHLTLSLLFSFSFSCKGYSVGGDKFFEDMLTSEVYIIIMGYTFSVGYYNKYTPLDIVVVYHWSSVSAECVVHPVHCALLSRMH